ncbi:C-type lectin domain family 10 member A-like isoform X1 [Dunckerocampus dactyliophorus]|uniref:C-type lectin domain family 10 member A-like isoform X1 n=1 Tax=Dunckerocampus dactyliophorus TaxID=161453 RepID=UPI0024071B97|nr:C-type lectin domain family 10 member A-like isoform X1 [Dunckerocampus dactyliophorus]XP_054646055.1 C-type lectin domain family 10 member A-like isoform X1 [Dunckerocampus dactyliophorus]
MQRKLNMAGKKLDMPGKKPPKAFILPVATIRLTFVIGLLFIAMALAETVKGQNLTAKLDGLTEDVANLNKSLNGFTEAFIGYGSEVLSILKDLKGRMDNLKNVTANITQDLREHVENMDKKLTGQVKELTQDVEDVLMKAGIKCPPQWHSHETRCYLLVVEMKTWYEARDYCVANGGQLASVHTKATYDFLKGLTCGWNTWVGGSKESTVWKWIDGSTFSVKENGKGHCMDASWAPGEPNYGDPTYIFCTEIRPSVEGLNDCNCDGKHPFLCQK